jgi:hypothetical protein
LEEARTQDREQLRLPTGGAHLLLEEQGLAELLL